MAFTLIPFPISILFIAVFAVAFLVVLWKLRKNGKVYRVLFWAVTSFLLVVIILAAATAAFQPSIPSGGGPVVIQIVLEKLSYAPDEKMVFSIYVYNHNDWNVPYPKLVSYSIGSTTGSIQFEREANFAPQSQTFIQNLTHSEHQPGNYTLTVSLRGQVDYGNTSSLTVTIKSPS